MPAAKARPFRDLCPEGDRRDAMPDDEFWPHVFPNPAGPDTDYREHLDVQLEVEPCPVCGAQGACSYDAEGRPLIHTDTELPKD